MRRAIAAIVFLILFYLTGVFWIPPVIGMYLYAERPARLRHFATEAGIENAEKVCGAKYNLTPGAEEEMTACFDRALEEGRGRYMEENL